MVESVYRHNKTWQFIRWSCDTFGPCAHSLACLFSRSPGSSLGGTYLFTWTLIQPKNWSFPPVWWNWELSQHVLKQPTSYILWWPFLALSVSHLLLHGVVVQKGSQVHRDMTYDTALQTGVTHMDADRVQGLWVHRGLRNSGANSFQLTGAMKLVSTRQHGHLTSRLQQQIYRQTGDTVWWWVGLHHTTWTDSESREMAALHSTIPIRMIKHWKWHENYLICQFTKATSGN